MCGITGYLNLNGQPLSRDEVLLGFMSDRIRHRGPDDQGFLTMGPVALGMRRLSIIDLKTGHQPIGNEDGSVWIVYNGEIFNYRELQERIVAHGHRLSTKSDTETIVHLYEEYGIDCLQFLEGQFAFALWDHERQRLFIARDRMGEKPLHWGVFDGQFIFGSEMSAMLAHPGVKRRVNFPALQRYLALEYVPAPDSLFEGIHKLPPASFALVEQGQVKIKTYWEPHEKPVSKNEKEAGRQLIEELERSVKLQLIADVPVGVFLSGGIDSSTIAALAARNRIEPLKTFSIGFSDSSFDESEPARLVAAHIGTDHHAAIFEPELALQTAAELWNVLDEPIGDASIIPTYFLSKMARKCVKVALAGEGGDELFGGYPTYQAHKLAALWNRMPAALRRGVLEPLVKNFPVSLNNLSFDYKAKRFVAAAGYAPIKRHLRWMGSIPIAEQSNLIKPELLELWRDEQLYPVSDYESGDVVSTIMRLDMNTYLPNDLLVKSDRASMAASLELRLPFLAYPLVEFALGIPECWKVHGMTTKYLLRKAAAPLLPASILKRPKKGFGIPVGKWLQKEFKPMVDELLNKEFISRQDIFEWPHVNGLLQAHQQGKRDCRKELWTLLMFQCWWQKYFGSGRLSANMIESKLLSFAGP